MVAGITVMVTSMVVSAAVTVAEPGKHTETECFSEVQG